MPSLLFCYYQPGFRTQITAPFISNSTSERTKPGELRSHFSVLFPNQIVGSIKENLLDCDMRDGLRDFGQQIEVRCWESVDARVATPTPLSYEILEKLASEIIREVSGIVSVTYNIAPKPPSTIEAV